MFQKVILQRSGMVYMGWNSTKETVGLMQLHSITLQEVWDIMHVMYMDMFQEKVAE